MMEKIKLSRGKFELLAIVVILICGLSIFSLKIKSKTSLIYDSGKITYTGYVVNHRMNGQEKLTYENGDVYAGAFVDGVFDGEGTFTSHTGWSYTGEFQQGQADGQGTLKAINNEVYAGTFKQGIYQK